MTARHRTLKTTTERRSGQRYIGVVKMDDRVRTKCRQRPRAFEVASHSAIGAAFKITNRFLSFPCPPTAAIKPSPHSVSVDYHNTQ